MKSRSTRSDETPYEFIREDNGESVYVSFEAMMRHVGGVIDIETEQGQTVLARRASQVEEKTEKKQKNNLRPDAVQIVSDSLGFVESQFAEMEADRKMNNFTDVEFVRDPDVPAFFQVKIGSEAAKQRYMKHRGLHDASGRNGSKAMLSDRDLDAAKKLMIQKYPVTQKS